MNFAEYNQYCSIEGHQQRQIQGICVNKKCQEERAICFVCSQLLHQKHEKSDLLDFPLGTSPWIQERIQEYSKIQSLLLEYLQKIKTCFTNLQKVLENEFQPAAQLQCLKIEYVNKRVNALISLKEIQLNLEKKIGQIVDKLTLELCLDKLSEVVEQKKSGEKIIIQNHPTSPYDFVKGHQFTSKPPPKPSDKKLNVSTAKIVIKNESKDNQIESNFFTCRYSIDRNQKSPKKWQPMKLMNHIKSSSINVRHKTLPGTPFQRVEAQF